MMDKKIISGNNSINIISGGSVNLNLQLDRNNLTGPIRDIIKDEVRSLIYKGDSLEREASRNLAAGDTINAEKSIDLLLSNITKSHSKDMLKIANLYALVNKDKAIYSYKRAYESDAHNLDAINYYALYLINLGYLKEAEVIYLKALNDLVLDAELEPIEGNLGILYKNLGDYDKAIEHLIIASELSVNLDKDIGSAKHLNNLGSCYNNQGEFKEAIDVLTLALRVVASIEKNNELEKKDIKSTESSILTNISISYKVAFQHTQNSIYLNKAIDYALQGVEICEENKLDNYLGRLFGNLANFYDLSDNREKHREYLIKTKDTFTDQSSDKDRLTCLMNLGLLYFREGNPTKAIEYYLDCLKQGVSDKYKKLHALTQYNLAIAQHSTGEIEQAKSAAEIACSLFEELEDYSVVEDLKQEFKIS